MVNVIVFGFGIILGMVTNNIYRDIRELDREDEDD